MIIHNPGNYKKINELYVWVFIDSNGNEGIIAHVIGGQSMLLVTSEKKVADKMGLLAREYTLLSGMEARMLHFKLACP